MKPPRFFADDMLARLARWLRGAGIDVAYLGQGTDDDTILRAARREGRVVLTRDTRFPGGPEDRIILEATGLDDQLVELLRRFFPFDPFENAFTRCMECNGPIRAESEPPPQPAGVTGPYTRCESCGRLFWEGSHTDRIRERLAHVKERVAAVVEEEKRGEPPPFERGEYDRFLKEAFHLLGFSWRGYRRVRFGLRTRIRRRLKECGLRTLAEYLDRIRRDGDELFHLGSMLRITISRFFRDRETWLRFPTVFFPPLAEFARGGPVRVWSLGCASGEEPFTLRMMWDDSPFRETPLEIAASDLSEESLARARDTVYHESSIHVMPGRFREKYFSDEGGAWRLDRSVARSVRFERFDWREKSWPRPFHAVFARNGPFTYLGEEGKGRILRKIAASLDPGGFLWIGGNESLSGVRGERWKTVEPGLFRYEP